MNKAPLSAATALLTTLALIAGCSSSKSDDKPTNESSLSDENPAVVAGVPLPDGSVDKAVGDLDGLVADVMGKSGIPGMAIAVVHGGKTVYAKGFGVKDVKGDDKVDPDTVFQIASVSKSISATVVAHEVTAGNVKWDTPVAEIMPSFTLGDPWVGSHATIGDFFSHRSGLPGAAGDILEDLGFDRRYILDHLRLLPLNPFRVTYAYANFGLTTGAEAVATKAKKEWADLAEEAIYKPLGLKSTSSRFADFEKEPNRATLHMRIDNKWVHDLVRDADQQSPAGGVSSNVNDLAKWLTMVLGKGAFEGKQIFSEEAFQPAITPQVVSSRGKSPDARSGFYGYGYNVGTTPAGRVELSHSGGFVSGASTNILLIPSADVAIVALTNAAPTGVPEAVTQSFADIVQYGKVKEDWVALYEKAISPLLEPTGSLVGKPRPTDPAPAKPVADYVGTYANDYFGPATISEKDGNLVLGLGPAGKTFPLTHWDGDTFTFTLVTENAPPGTISKATFDGNRLNLEYYDSDKLGTFVR